MKAKEYYAMLRNGRHRWNVAKEDVMEGSRKDRDWLPTIDEIGIEAEKEKGFRGLRDAGSGWGTPDRKGFKREQT